MLNVFPKKRPKKTKKKKKGVKNSLEEEKRLNCLYAVKLII